MPRVRPVRQKRQPSSSRLVGYLEPCLLLLLTGKESHGYDLIDRLASCGYWGSDCEPSLVYRVLRKMESAGSVSSKWDMTGAGGPPRRVYSITANGRESLTGWTIYLQETERILQRFLAAHEKLIRNERVATKKLEEQRDHDKRIRKQK